MVLNKVGCTVVLNQVVLVVVELVSLLLHPLVLVFVLLDVGVLAYGLWMHWVFESGVGFSVLALLVRSWVDIVGRSVSQC